MTNTIIAVYGRAAEGKSETIKTACQLVLDNFQEAIPSTPRHEINYDNDILISIQVGVIKIGFESQGDPGSRMITKDTIRQLADITVNNILGGCNIIVCATRTAKDTVKRVDQIASELDYAVIWKSSYYSPNLNHSVLNNLASNEIFNLIDLIINDNL